MQETRDRSLGWEDPLEKEMATHSSILAWRIPMDRGAWWATVHGITKSGTGLSDFTHTHTHTPPLSYPDLHSRIFSTEKTSKGGGAQE